MCTVEHGDFGHGTGYFCNNQEVKKMPEGDTHTYRCGMYGPPGPHSDFVCDCSCHYNLYKITVFGDDADNAVGNLFSDDLFFRVTRVSPIAFFARLSDSDAIELAQFPNYSVTRAPEDWKI